MKLLSPTHISDETAYLVSDYPYGFKLRCQIKFWIEWNNRGARFCYQTTNPRSPNLRWNKPKKTTYDDLMVMFLDDNTHVKTSSINLAYANEESLTNWLTKYQDGVPDTAAIQEQIKMAFVCFEARKYVKITTTINDPNHVSQTKEESNKIIRLALQGGKRDFEKDGGIL